MPTNIKEHIRTVPGFPKEGILFYDIATLLANGPVWAETIRQLKTLVEKESPDYLVGIEARGFLFAAALASEMGVGMIMVRKKGKLPGETSDYQYNLEYGTDTLSIQKGIVPEGKRGVLIDDILATGGTACAAIALSKTIGLSISKAVFLAELTFLNGRAKVPVPVSSLLSYDD